MIDRLRHSQDLAAVHLAQQSQSEEPAWDVFSGALDDTVVIEVPSPRHARQDAAPPFLRDHARREDVLDRERVARAEQQRHGGGDGERHGALPGAARPARGAS